MEAGCGGLNCIRSVPNQGGRGGGAAGGGCAGRCQLKGSIQCLPHHPRTTAAPQPDSPTLHTPPAPAAIKFLTYEQLSRKISHHLIDAGGDGQLTPLLRLLAGAGARGGWRAGAAACCPGGAVGLAGVPWRAPGRPAHAGAPAPHALGSPPHPPPHTPAPLSPPASGAGIIGMSATYPMDMVRGRITIQESGRPQYRGLLHATGCIVREEGLLALWRGWLPSVIGVVPYVGLNFGVYETAKDVIIKTWGALRCAAPAVHTHVLCARSTRACVCASARNACCCAGGASTLRRASLFLGVLHALRACRRPRRAACCRRPHAGLRDERDLSIAVRLGCGALAGTMGQVRRRRQSAVRRRAGWASWGRPCPTACHTHTRPRASPHPLPAPRRRSRTPLTSCAGGCRCRGGRGPPSCTPTTGRRWRTEAWSTALCALSGRKA